MNGEATLRWDDYPESAPPHLELVHDESGPEPEDEPPIDLDASAPCINSVALYLNQAAKAPLLNRAQEVELAKRIEAGTQAASLLAGMSEDDDSLKERRAELTALEQDGNLARNTMLESNLRLVVSIAKRKLGRGLDLLDLIQEGNIGLMTAVEKFDYTKGFKFSTYATWWVSRGMNRAIADQGRTIRIPVHLWEAGVKIGRVRRELQNATGLTPTPEEIAEAADMPLERVLKAIATPREPLRLDMPVGDEEGVAGTLGDVIADKSTEGEDEIIESIIMDDDKVMLEALLGVLDERSRAVMRMRHGYHGGEPMTQAAIGRAIGVTHKTVGEIERRALAAMRQAACVGTTTMRLASDNGR